MALKTEAIVLGTQPYSETTLLARLLTREAGVVRAIAKGARRKGRQAQASFEPLAHVDALIRLGGKPDALATLYEAAPRPGWPWLRRDLDRFAFAAVGIEVLGAVAALHPPAPAYFIAARRYLDRMGETPGPGSLTIALLAGLLEEAGFPVRMADPAWTEETLPQRLTWDGADMVLREATPLEPAAMPRQAAVVLAAMLRDRPGQDGPPMIAPAAGRSILRWLTRLWESHLGRPLASARYLEQMVLAQPRKDEHLAEE